jgi:peptidoglycan hydrolase CwlO-like protein
MSDPALNEVVAGLHAQIQSVRLDMRQLHEHAMHEARQQIEAQQAEIKRLEQQILDLDVRIQRYQSYDRYSITRAHVMQIMRGIDKDKP